MKRKILAMATGLIGMAMSQVAEPCTAVDIQAKDGSMIASRTMEWFFDMQWQVVSVPQGSEFQMTAPSTAHLAPVAKHTKYGIVGVAPGIIPGITFVEGQNTAGLGMSGNFLPGFTQYQTVTPQDKEYISILGFGTWALGSFANVAELEAALPNIKVWYDSSLESGPTAPTLHFVFNDRSGQGIVVEFVDGEMKIYKNKAHILTNAPTYDWQLTNLRNYINITDTIKSAVKVNDINVTALGSGGNTMALRADYSPPSRFVRTAFLRWNTPQPETANDARQLTAHILNNVDIPEGVAGEVVGKQTAWDRTQWIALKDLSNNQLYIADYDHRTNFVKIDLDQLTQTNGITKKAIRSLPYTSPTDVTSSLAN